MQHWLRVLDLYRFQVVVHLQLEFMECRLVTEVWNSIRWRSRGGDVDEEMTGEGT